MEMDSVYPVFQWLLREVPLHYGWMQLDGVYIAFAFLFFPRETKEY